MLSRGYQYSLKLLVNLMIILLLFRFLLSSPALKVKHVKVKLGPERYQFLFKELEDELLNLKGENFLRAKAKAEQLLSKWRDKIAWKSLNLSWHFPSEITLSGEISEPIMLIEHLRGANYEGILLNERLEIVAITNSPPPVELLTVTVEGVKLSKAELVNQAELVEHLKPLLKSLLRIRKILESNGVNLRNTRWLEDRGVISLNVLLSKIGTVKVSLGAPIDLKEKVNLLTRYLSAVRQLEDSEEVSELLPSISEGYLMVLPDEVIVVRYREAPLKKE